MAVSSHDTVAVFISIHALLAESDRLDQGSGGRCRHFYPRSPCGERLTDRLCYIIAEQFYPRSPCGERRSDIEHHHGLKRILSTLSLRRATWQWLLCTVEWLFLSTLSLRRATPPVTRRARNLSNFYPRSPCGERLAFVGFLLGLLQFLSTLSLRRATALRRPVHQERLISIHALLAESDGLRRRVENVHKTFLSTTLLCGERLSKSAIVTSLLNFYPRLPAESDGQPLVCIKLNHHFIHALLAESDRYKAPPAPTYQIFIHALLAERRRR